MFGRRRSDDTPPRTGFDSWSWRGSAAVIGVIVILLVGVLIAVATGHGAKQPTAAATPAPAPAPAPVSGAGGGDAGRPAGCATAGTDQTVPTGPPTGVTWTLASGFAVPGTAADGPVLHGPAGVGYCFSHTPLGALLASANLGHGTGTDPEIQAASVTLSIATNQYTAQLAASPATTTPSRPGIQIAGFRVVSYTPDAATVTLAASIPSTQGGSPILGQLTIALAWEQGDWRAVPQAGPTIFLNTAQAPSLAGFVAWAGVA